VASRRIQSLGPCGTRELEGIGYLLLVNDTESPQSTEITLSGMTYSPVRADDYLEQNDGAYYKEGRVSVSLSPEGSAVLRLTPPSSETGPAGIAISETTAAPGEMVEVQIQADDQVADLQEINLTLGYDPSLSLRTEDIEVGNLLKEAVFAMCDCQPGSLLLYAQASRPVKGPGILFMVRFHVAPNALSGSVLPIRVKTLSATGTDWRALPLSVQAGSVTVTNGPAVQSGDVNRDGKVSVADATLMLRWVVGLPVSTEYDRFAGDINGDGKTDLTDATRLLRMVLGG
jgi:hypothetical protein